MNEEITNNGTHKAPELGLHSVRRNALIEWLTEEYSIEEATDAIDNAVITEIDGKITINYGIGATDIVTFIDDKIVQLY